MQEHPWSASPWRIPEVQDIMKDKGVMTVYADMCMHDPTTKGLVGQEHPSQKPIDFLANLWAIAEELIACCDKPLLCNMI